MNSPYKRLIIVRHGNTFRKGDTLLRVGRNTDLDLVENEKGTKAGKFIKTGHYNVTKIVSGPLKRHRQTAHLIANTLGFNHSKITIDARLNELDYGDYDGRPEKAVQQQIGQEALNKWDEFAIPPPTMAS